MNGVRVIFSPHTADPHFVAEVAAAIVAAQLSVAQAMWGAQTQVLRAMLTAQFTFMDSVSRAAARPR
jgi:hypothetical protein